MAIDSKTFGELTKILSKVPADKGPGKIIVLNGTSSSGKTTIAKLLQSTLFENGFGSYLYFPVDFFEEEALPPQVTSQPRLLVEELPRIVYGYSSAVAAACAAGLNIIVDIVFTELHWTHDFQRKTTGLDVTYIKVACDLEKTKQREQERPNRPNGLAEYQYDRIHRGIRYDLSLDTSRTNPQESIAQILEYLSSIKESPL